MTRIILVHGINNEKNSAEAIERDWIASLVSAAAPAVVAKLKAAEVVAPFYGKVLADWTEGRGAAPKPVAQAVEEPGSEEAEFYREALEEIVPAAKVSEAEVQKEAFVDGPVEQGLPHDRRLLALVRALERVSPFHGSIALKILPQAFTYLKRPGVADDIDAIVRPELEKGPAIIIAHSLGTIVTFKLLRQGASPAAPLYLTAGSPLAITAVKNAIGPRFARPKAVARWVNALDINDAVTLGKKLDEKTFAEGIKNLYDIENGDEDRHSIIRYLKDKAIAEELAKTL
jgi:pimeloyl-ACP methyl ester carboxylesterase